MCWNCEYIRTLWPCSLSFTIILSNNRNFPEDSKSCLSNRKRKVKAGKRVSCLQLTITTLIFILYNPNIKVPKNPFRTRAYYKKGLVNVYPLGHTLIIHFRKLLWEINKLSKKLVTFSFSQKKFPKMVN